MATKKISELTEVTSPISTDVFPIVNDGETKKVQLTNVKTVLGIDGLDTRLTTAEGEIDTAQTDINNAEAVIGNETDTYSASSTYALGDLVIYNNLLYKCTTAISTPESWNASKWTQTNLTEEISKPIIVSANDGTAYKYSNGLMICVYSATVSINSFSTEGSISRFGVNLNKSLPSTFKTLFNASMQTIDYNNNYFYGSELQETTLSAWGTIRGYVGMAIAGSIDVRLIAIGTWK